MLEVIKTVLGSEPVLLAVFVVIGLCVAYERIVEVLNNIEQLPASASTISQVVNMILPVAITLAAVLGASSEQVNQAQQVALEVAAAIAAFFTTTLGTWLVHQVFKLFTGEAVIGFLKSTPKSGRPVG